MAYRNFAAEHALFDAVFPQTLALAPATRRTLVIARRDVAPTSLARDSHGLLASLISLAVAVVTALPVAAFLEDGLLGIVAGGLAFVTAATVIAPFTRAARRVPVATRPAY